jgi:Fe-S oxidoreductase
MRVILWADTFNDHFHPETLIAAVAVLEQLGCDVHVPAARLCCGRPLYDFGYLSIAKRRLAEIMAALDADIRAGTPIIGLEPSCVSVFRDELVNLFPSSEQAHRLRAQAFTLGEWLDRQAPRLAPYRLERRAIVHGHCHHKAVMGFDAEQRVLRQLGVRAEHLDSGCCGMAGAFGFEAEHYGVSMAIGERVLLPRVRDADLDTMVLSDGFSCREQIAQATGRRALHLAEVVHLAMEQGPHGPAGDRPERAVVADHSGARLTRRELTGAGMVAAGVALAILAARRLH